MAITAEEIIIDLELNADPATKSIDELETQLTNLKDALKGTKVGSDEFKKLQKEVIKADSRVKNLNKSIEGLDTEQVASEIGKLGGGITAAFTGVAALVGNSNEEFEKFTKNIVTGIAVAQGIKGATESWTAAQKLLNIAMAANPVGLLVAGIAALTAGIVALVTVMGDYSEEGEKAIKMQKELDTVMSKHENTILDLQIKLANINEEYEKSIELQGQLFKNEQANEFKVLLEEITQKFKEQGDEFEIGGDKIKKGLEEQTNLIGELAVLKEKQDTATNKDFLRRNAIEIAAIEEKLEVVKKTNEEAIKSTEKYKKAEKLLIEKQAAETALQNAKLAKENKDREDKRLADAKAINDKILEERKEFLAKLTDLEQKFSDELRVIRNENADLDVELAIQNLELNKELYDKELDALKLKSDRANIVRQEELAEDKRLREEQLAVVLGITEAELDDEKKRLEAVKKLNQEELIIYNDILKEINEIEVESAETTFKIREKLQNDLLILQNQRKENFIDVLEILQQENERNSINLIDNVRERNLKIIDLEAALSSETIMGEIKKNENIIRLAEERKTELEKNADVNGEELTIINEQLKKLQETNVALGEKLELVGKSRDAAKEEAEALSDTASLNAIININNRKLALVEGYWERERKLLIENLEINTQLELEALETQHSQGIITTEQYEMAKKDIEDKFRQDKVKADIEGYKKAIAVGEQLFGDFQQILINQTTAKVEEELALKNEAFDAEIEALDGLVEAGIETEESKLDKLAEIERRREQAERQAAYDQAKAEKQQALIKVAIDTATAVVEAAPIVPLQIQAGLLGASQAALIASQPLPQLKKGGKILKGKKHHDGGIPLYQNGTQIAEVEGGETIMTAGVANSPILLSMASMINEMAGGVSFTDNAFSPAAATTPAQQQQVNVAAIVRETVKGVTSIPVVNVATNTTKVDKKVKNIEAKSRF